MFTLKSNSKFAPVLFIAGFAFVTTLVTSCERHDSPIGGKATVKTAYPDQEKLADIKEPGSVEVASLSKAAGPDGEKLFIANCGTCHQQTGEGVPGAFPPLNKSKYVVSDNVDRIAAIMLYGLNGEITVRGTKYNGVMTPVGHLKDSELAAIATYIRGAWENKASEVSEDVFKAAREKHKTRGAFTIQELGVEEGA